ncbi:MAG: hypothetical protein AAGJ52_10535, partial [Pseudomonadota bacterium]
MMIDRSLIKRFAALIFVSMVAAAHAAPVSYQGQLTSSGAPFDGNVDLRFRLFEQASGGSAHGPQIVRNNWPVDNGLFQVDLDFDPSLFDGRDLYLEVRVNDTPLEPRQRVTATPVAAFALNGNEGPAGPQGPQGPSGSDGAVGPVGPQGPIGP